MGNSVDKTYTTFEYSPIKIKCCKNAVKYYNDLYNTSGIDDPHTWRWNRIECYTDFIRAMFSLLVLLICISLLVHYTKIKKN